MHDLLESVYITMYTVYIVVVTLLACGQLIGVLEWLTYWVTWLQAPASYVCTMNISECQLIRIIRPTAVLRPLQTKFLTTPMEGLSVFGAMQIAQWRNATPNPTPTPTIAPFALRRIQIALWKHWLNTVSAYVCSFKPVFEKTCATSQKNVKSHVFWIFKKT